MSVTVYAVRGTEADVCNMARVSTKTEHEYIEAVGPKDITLLHRLVKDRHGVPFEHVAMTFHVATAIYVAREWFRHRIGSFSEMSGRYVEMPRLYLVPRPRADTGKAMDYLKQDVPNAAWAEFEAVRSIRDSFSTYQDLLDAGLSREFARCVLPLSTLTQFMWTVNLRSLMNFLQLRNHPAALEEIRVEAERVEHYFKLKFPHIHEAFVKNGRVAP